MPAFVSFPGSAAPVCLHDKYLACCCFSVSSVRNFKACSGSLTQYCPVLTFKKFRFLADLDFSLPQLKWVISVPIHKDTEQIIPCLCATVFFVVCPFVPLSSPFLGAKQCQIIQSLLLCDLLNTSKGKKYISVEIF